MQAWAVHGVALPFGDQPAWWWIDGSGAVHDQPVAGADLLPGGFVLPGLVDAHAHPAVGSGPAGLVALAASAAGSAARGAQTAPPPGPVVTPVAAALVPGPLKVIRRSESNVLTARLDFQPGASTGWHYHRGPVFVQVVAGAVTLSHAAHGRCVSQVVPAGRGFFEFPGAVHVAENREGAGGGLRHLRPPARAPPSVATPTPAPCR